MRSIKMILSFCLSLVIVLVGFSTALLYFYQTVQKEKAALNQFVLTESNIIPDELALSVWKYDINGLSLLCSQRLRHHRIQAIRVTDEGHNLVFESAGNIKNPAVTVVKPIRFQGELIGEATIIFDLSELQEYKGRIINATLLTLLLVVCTAITSVFFLIRNLVEKPFLQLSEILLEIQNEKYDWGFKGRKSNEILPILDSLSTLSQELNKRNTELAEHTYNLENTNMTLLQEIDLRAKVEVELLKSGVIIELASDGVITTSTEGTIKYWNSGAEKIYGYGRDEVLGKSIALLYKQEDLPILENLIGDLLQGKDLSNKEIICLDKKQKEVNILLSLVTIRDANGKVVELVGFTRDVTEKVALQAQLQQTQKMEAIGNLAGGIAHDFNNILSAIMGFTELALDESTKGSEQEENLNEVYRASSRARDLVKQILAFARQTDEKVEPIRILSLIQDVIKLLRPSTPANIEILTRLNSNPLISGNASQLHQVVLNLCTNSIQAMQNGGVLELELKDITIGSDAVPFGDSLVPGQYTELLVSDNGLGILPENRAKIFEPYFTTKQVGEGSGMGLAMVKGIIESHGGEVRLLCEPQEKTVFSVRLPITSGEEGPLSQDADEIKGGSEHILFVDDEPPIARMGTRMLQNLGYRVTARTDSLEALELLKENAEKFDLVLTDMTMPHLTGDELVVEMRKIRPGLPVIICTGYSSVMSEARARQLGINGFAYKPFSKKDFATIIRQVLDPAS